MKTAMIWIGLLLPGIPGVGVDAQPASEIRVAFPADQGASAASRTCNIDLFGADDLLEMTISMDIRGFIKTKNHPQYVDAVLTVKVSDNDSLTEPIKLKARGEMRRSYCSFPPILIKFKGNENDTERIIQGKGTLKLVTHCQSAAAFEGYVLKEYLAYKLYNLVTPYSFKTRLVRIHYQDVNRPEKSFAAYGFLIENASHMAQRNHAVLIKAMHATQKHMAPMEITRVAFFNYMIGNTDWTVPYQHNVKLLNSLETPMDKAIPVVYDFDYSGFVNARYAVPFEELPIKHVSERYYLGLCGYEKEWQQVTEEFEKLEDEFMHTVRDFEYLSQGDRKYVESYLNSFYESCRHKNYLIGDLNRTCKRF
jgi:hypothetical protein